MALGQVTINDVSGVVKPLTVNMGADMAPTETDGVGGWTVVTGVKSVGFVEYAGHNPAALDLPLWFNGFPNTSVEDDINHLIEFALVPNNGQSPPTILIDGPIPNANFEWVIFDLQWGTDVEYNDQGQRVRQDVIVKLYHARFPSIVVSRAKPSAAAKSYTTTKGDTLRSIAAKKLGGVKHWREIAKLNPKYRDPSKKLAGKIHLRLP